MPASTPNPNIDRSGTTQLSAVSGGRKKYASIAGDARTAEGIPDMAADPLVAAFRSMSARTSSARRCTVGSDLIFSIQLSTARRTSSVTVRSLSPAMMSSCARVDSLSLTASGLGRV